MNTVKVIINNGQNGIQYNVPIKDGKVYKIKATENSGYTVQNADSNNIIEKIVTTRKGDDLHLSFSDNQQENLIIENFYSQPNAQLDVVGLSQDGSYFSYSPVVDNANIAELVDGEVATQVISTQQPITPWWVAESASAFSPMLLAAGGLGLSAVAISSNKSDSNEDSSALTENKAPTDIVLPSSIKNNFSITENTNGLKLGELSTVDPNNKDSHTYTVNDDRFEIIDNNILAIKEDAIFDYEKETSLTLSITSTDSHGLSVVKEVKVHIEDVNEAPILTGDKEQIILEDQQQVSGILTVTDDDPADNPIGFEALADGALEGTYGKLEFTPGEDGTAKWVYTLDNEKAQELAQDEVFTENFTVTAVDNNGTRTEQVISVSVIGDNDTPIAVNETDSATIDFVWGDENINNQLINNLGGEKGYGEHEIPRLEDDSSTEAIDITSVFGEEGLNFYGTHYTSMYINSNGNITFNYPLRTYNPIPLENVNYPIIAPFWADVDPQGEIDNPNINRIWYDLDDTNKTLTVTWDQVGYYQKHTDKLNTFQMQIKDKGEGDFDVFFRYQDIQWTLGDSSYGTHARAGWTSGNGNFYEIPSSGNEAYMLSIEKFSNSGNPGVFEFNVVDGVVHEEGTGAYSAIIDVLANDTDIDHDAHLNLIEAHITQGEGAVNIVDNKVYYLATPEALTSGNSEVIIEYTIQDEHGATNTATATVTINSNFVNTAPESQDFSIETGGEYVFAPDDFPFLDPDLFNDLEAVIIKTLPTSGTLMLDGNAVVAGDTITKENISKLTYTASEDATETSDPATFTFAVVDNGGTANGGHNESTEYTATINKTNINHAPQAIDSHIDMVEDTPYTFTASDFGFADRQDGHNLAAINISRLPENGLLSYQNIDGERVDVQNGQTLTVDEISTLIYSPNENIHGEPIDGISYYVKDDGGLQNGGNEISANSANLLINIASQNDGAPTITGIDEIVDYQADGTPQSLFTNLLAHDEDPLGINDVIPGWSIHLSRDGAANADDVFIANENQGVRFTDGGDILLYSQDIGDVHNNQGELALEFAPGVNINENSINTVIQSILYQNESLSSGDNITLAWTIQDNDIAGSLSTSYEQTIHVI